MSSSQIIQNFKNTLPGILLCLFIAIPAYMMGLKFPLVGGPVFAILIGIFIALFYNGNALTDRGISFTSKKILQYAVILLGFGLNFSEIIKVGISSLHIIVSTIAISLIVSFSVFKIFKINPNTAILVGIGSSICGGSAIAATAPVVNAKDEEIAQAISVVFLFNVLAALIFPALGMKLGFTTPEFGLFAGTAVNDTSSVTATASAWDGIHTGSNALEIATVVKLTRTLAIIPITLALSLYLSAKDTKNKAEVFNLSNFFKKLPSFIGFFILASLISTFVASLGINPSLFSPLKKLSKFFIVMAMSAIGLKTDVIKLVKSGKSAVFLGACCWISITLLSILLIKI